MIKTFVIFMYIKYSQYSILDGIIRIDRLAARGKELNMPACGITDHGVLGGVLEFYKECKKQSIKPIIGIETYITDNPDGMNEGKTRDIYHMVLLAQNAKGFSNLCWLITNANM